MTINKSLISIAAATLLVAGFAGCGSSSSSSSSSTSSSSGGVVSSVKAVDGYLYNATVKAYYLKDDNTTMSSVTLTGTDTTKDTTTGVWTVGSSTYSLAEANSSIKDKIKFFKLTARGTTASSGSTFTPDTFIESGHLAGKDVNDTTFSTTLYAPANGAILSPLSNLVYAANSALIGTETTAGTLVNQDFNATTLASLEANATKFAAVLGLGDVNILTADPKDLIDTNPTYALVNSLLKTVTAAQATTLLAATAPTTASLQNTLQALSDAGLAGLTADLLTRVKNGSFTTANIAKMSIDQSVAAGSIVNKENATLAGSFPVDSIKLNGVETNTLTAAGAKVDANHMDIVLDMSNAKSDTNISNTAFNVYIKINGAEDTVTNSDSNDSSGLVIAIPFDMNLTDGVLYTNVATTSKVPFEVRSSDGQYSVYKGDFNASVMGVNGTSTYISAATTNLTIDVDAIIGAVYTQLDTNLTDPTNFETSAANIMAKISNVQVLLSTSSNLIKVTSDGLNDVGFATDTLSGITANISAVEVNKLFSVSTTDFRDTAVTTAAANKVPNETLDVKITATSDATAGAGTKASPWIVNDDSTVFLTMANGTFDTFEKNDTWTITSSSADLDLNTTTLIAYAKDNYNNRTAAGSEFNTSSTTAGDINYTITTKVTDEFGESNTTVYYLTGNRAPYSLDSNVSNLLTASTTVPTPDKNITLYLAANGAVDANLTYNGIADTNGTDGNLTSVKFTVSDYDGVAGDFNSSDGNISFVSAVCGQGTVQTINTGDTVLGIYFGADTNETNLSFKGDNDGIFYLNLETNGSTVVASGVDCNISLEVYDKYGATINDYNMTINVSN